MSSKGVNPHLVVADRSGKIYDHPRLLLLCRKGSEWQLPRPDELMPLPAESELFSLPGRHALGFNPKTGQAEEMEEMAVAAFVAPAHTLTAHPAYVREADAPMLPLFAYGAVGYARGRFYVCAKRVDKDLRQVFCGVNDKKLKNMAHKLAADYPENRLMQHLMFNCALRYSCPAAKNLCLGRYEAPLPISRFCNARCIGCISFQDKNSKICSSPQNRLNFTPEVREIVEIMLHHEKNERANPIFSFGQGCEGEPLTEADLLIQSILEFRRKGGRGTVNLNSNASKPDAIFKLAKAGLTSLRVSLNSARKEVYTRYYRPQNYSFSDMRTSILTARACGVFVSLNLLYFPGISDSEEELDALIELVSATDINFIQLRNLNIDPEYYLSILAGLNFGPSVGLTNFRKRLKRTCPWIEFGYFNPWLGDKYQARG